MLGKLPRLLNRLTEITLEIDLGNLKEANAAHCLFQVAPNLRRVELQVQLMKVARLAISPISISLLNSLYFAAYLQGLCHAHLGFLGLH